MNKCSLCGKEHDTNNFMYCPDCIKSILQKSGIDESEILTEEEQEEQKEQQQEVENYCLFCRGGGCVQCEPKNYL